MGFGVPAGIGVAAATGRRPLILVGDGAFQMTGIELATALRFACNPIVVLLDNDGYTTERYLVDGSFNDLLRWDYSRLADLLQDDRLPHQGMAVRVETEGELDAALRAARDHADGFFLLDVRLERMDGSDAVRKLWAQG
jgi:indolepyruvate decarboxylase